MCGRYFTSIGVLWFLAGNLFLVAHAAGQADARQRAIAPLVELAFLDSPGTPQARETLAIRISSDGAVWVPRDPGGTLEAQDRLSPQRLDAILQEIVQRGRFHQIDSQQLQTGLQHACRLAGLSEEVEGAAETIIRLDWEGRRHEVRIGGLSVMAARFPDFPELQRLLTIQLRLQNVAAVARAGGEQASLRLAAIANRTFQSAHPDQPPLSVRDLSMVRSLDTGSRYVQFYRRPENGEEEWLVSLFEMPGQPPRVNVSQIRVGQAGARAM